MGLISFGGLGSGLDVNGIIDALVEAERAPKQLSLDRKEANIQISLTGLGSLKSALEELRTIAFDLSLSSNFGKRNVSTESNEFFSASATSSATVGSFDVEVQSLAKGSELQSQVFTGGASTTFGAGTLTFTANSESFNVDVEASDTLESIRTKVNDAAGNIGVTVNLLNNVTLGPDTGSVLSFESETTGLGNDLAVTFTGDASLADISTGLSNIQSASSATIVIDGFSATSETNEFSNLLDGITINAKATNDAAESTSLNVSLDTTSVKNAVSSFVSSYNAYAEVQNGLGGADPSAPGLLLGDYTLREVSSRIRTLLSEPVTSAGEDFNSLSAIGISTTRTGTLELDESVLDAAISNNFEKFETLFTGDDGFATKLNETIDQYTGFDGILVSREDSLNDQLGRIFDQRVDLDFRVEQLQVRLRKQYAAADTIIAQFNSTGSFIAQQLANLPGFSSGSKD